MVASKRGRGGKAKAANAKVQEEQPQQQVEETTETSETSITEETDPMEQSIEEKNGEAEPMEQAAVETSQEAVEAAEGGAASQESTEAEAKPEEKKEEKVEPGRLLVENLPSSFLFDYQDKLKELFSKHGEIASIKRGPMNITELTTTPTLSAIVEFKNKDSLEKALTENGAVFDGNKIAVAVESRAETAVLVGVPYEASADYVKVLFSECGEVIQIQEFIKARYKILRVTFQAKEGVEKALKLDRELRINGFLVTVNKYRDDDEKNNNSNKNKRQSNQNNRNNQQTNVQNQNNTNRNNNFRGRGGATFNARPNFRGDFSNGASRGRGTFPTRGAAFPRGGFAGGMNSYMPPAYMPARPQGGFMNDGQRPNKRLRQM